MFRSMLYMLDYSFCMDALSDVYYVQILVSMLVLMMF